jgi:hypothetical protein
MNKPSCEPPGILVELLRLTKQASSPPGVARIVGDATKRAQELALPISTEMFGARLRALAEAARIEGPATFGNGAIPKCG